MSEFSIGWGLIPMPRSGDKAYDRRAKAYFKRWASKKKVCDIRRMQDYCGQQTAAFSDTVVDGEVFRVKRFDAFGRPSRQTFRSEQVGGLFGSMNPGRGWWNGIHYNEDWAPLEYEFRKALAGGTNLFSAAGQIYDAAHVQHIFDHERSNQNRGLPWAYSALNTGIDCIDIDALEKACHKINAALFGSIETPTGSMPGSFGAGGGLAGQLTNQWQREPTSQFASLADFPNPGSIGMLYVAMDHEITYRWTGSNGTGPGSGYVIAEKKSSVRYLNVHGTMIPLFRTGEKLTPNNEGRSLNAREFLEFLFNGLAVAFGVPVELIWNMARLGGAAVRGTAELGKRAFERCQRMMIDGMCQDDYENITGLGILAYHYPGDYPGIEPLAPPVGMDGWDVCTWRGPRDFTVDKGRDGKMYLELIRAGLMSREEWWTMGNEDPDEMEAVPTRELASRRKIWLAEDLPEDKFWLREFGAQGTFSVRDQEAGPTGGAAPAGFSDEQMTNLAETLADMLKNGR